MLKQKSMSNNRPIEGVDNTSSPTTVYVRENIVEKEVLDDFINETYTIYEYDETQYTLEEYKMYQVEQNVLKNSLATIEMYEIMPRLYDNAELNNFDLRMIDLYVYAIENNVKTTDEVPMQIKQNVVDKINTEYN